MLLIVRSPVGKLTLHANIDFGVWGVGGQGGGGCPSECVEEVKVVFSVH